MIGMGREDHRRMWVPRAVSQNAMSYGGREDKAEPTASPFVECLTLHVRLNLWVRQYQWSAGSDEDQ